MTNKKKPIESNADEETVADVLATLNDKQKKVAMYLIGKAINWRSKNEKRRI